MTRAGFSRLFDNVFLVLVSLAGSVTLLSVLIPVPALMLLARLSWCFTGIAVLAFGLLLAAVAMVTALRDWTQAK